MRGPDAAQHPFQVRFQEAPGALVLWFFLAPDDFGPLEAFQFLHKAERREGIELFDPQQIDVVQPARIAFRQQVVIDLARAQHDAPDCGIGLEHRFGMALLGIIPQHAVKAGAGGEGICL